MIIGIGTDIINISRIEQSIEKFGDKFLARNFTKQEIAQSDTFSGDKYSAYLAKRFAAKEAISKALGTGIGANIAFNEAEILNDPRGKPYVILYANALATLENLAGDNPKIDISLSDEPPFAQAFIVISTI